MVENEQDLKAEVKFAFTKNQSQLRELKDLMPDDDDAEKRLKKWVNSSIKQQWIISRRSK